VCEELYGRVRGAVEDSIEQLEQFRGGDPARDLFPYRAISAVTGTSSWSTTHGTRALYGTS